MTNSTATTTTTTTSAPTAAKAVADLNKRYADASAIYATTEREKLIVIIEGKLLIDGLGGPKPKPGSALCKLYNTAKIGGEFIDEWSYPAQLVTGLVIATTTDILKKKKARNYVGRAAKLMAAIDYFSKAKGSVHSIAGLSVEQIADWVEARGGVTDTNNLHAKLLKGAANDNSSDEVTNLDDYDKALLNPAITIPLNDIAVNAAVPTISVHRRVDDNLIVLPLANIPADLMDRLRAYLPAEDAHVPASVRFWGQATTLSQLFERKPSRTPLRPGEEQHAGSEMAPSRPIIRLLKDQSMRIAASRVDAGIVVRIEAAGLVLGDAKLFDEVQHINAAGTNLLIANLSSASGRASFGSVTVKKGNDGKRLLTFKPSGDGKDFKVPVRPMTAFGSSVTMRQWTLDVRSEFEPTVAATVEMADGVLPDDLTVFAGKASGSKHPVILKLNEGAITLSLGASQVWEIPSVEGGAGIAEVNLASDDFANAIRAAQDIRATSMSMAIDPKGMAMIQLHTEVSTVQICIPTLLESGGRSPALLVQVEKPKA